MPEQLTFLLEEPPARDSQSPESGEDSTTSAVFSRWPIYDFLRQCVRGGSSGKMCQVRSTQTEGQTSGASSRKLMPSGIMSRGECWTLSTCEWTAFREPSHSVGGVCSLSDILETGEIPRKYYLSRQACLGILRRADARGVELPRLLRKTLEEQTRSAPSGTGGRSMEAMYILSTCGSRRP